MTPVDPRWCALWAGVRGAKDCGGEEMIRFAGGFAQESMESRLVIWADIRYVVDGLVELIPEGLEGVVDNGIGVLGRGWPCRAPGGAGERVYALR